MPLVRAFGLNIDTGFDLPGAIAVDPAVTEGITVDVVIAEGAAELADATAVRAPYALAGHRLLFTADGVARYLCSGGNHIARDRGKILPGTWHTVRLLDPCADCGGGVSSGEW